MLSVSRLAVLFFKDTGQKRAINNEKKQDGNMPRTPDGDEEHRGGGEDRHGKRKG